MICRMKSFIPLGICIILLGNNFPGVNGLGLDVGLNIGEVKEIQEQSSSSYQEDYSETSSDFSSFNSGSDSAFGINKQFGTGLGVQDQLSKTLGNGKSCAGNSFSTLGGTSGDKNQFKDNLSSGLKSSLSSNYDGFKSPYGVGLGAENSQNQYSETYDYKSESSDYSSYDSNQGGFNGNKNQFGLSGKDGLYSSVKGTGYSGNPAGSSGYYEGNLGQATFQSVPTQVKETTHVFETLIIKQDKSDSDSESNELHILPAGKPKCKKPKKKHDCQKKGKKPKKEKKCKKHEPKKMTKCKKPEPKKSKCGCR